MPNAKQQTQKSMKSKRSRKGRARRIRRKITNISLSQFFGQMWKNTKAQREQRAEHFYSLLFDEFKRQNGL